MLCKFRVFLVLILCSFVNLPASAQQAANSLGQMEIDVSKTTFAVISVLSVTAKDDHITMIYRLQEGGMNHQSDEFTIVSENKIYGPLTANRSALSSKPSSPGRKGWVKFPVPPNNPETIDIYNRFSLPLEGVPVTYE